MTETAYLGIVLIYWSRYRINKTLFKWAENRQQYKCLFFSIRKFLLKACKTKTMGGKKEYFYLEQKTFDSFHSTNKYLQVLEYEECLWH